MAKAASSSGGSGKGAELVWPLPPEPPRIKYLWTRTSGDDYLSSFSLWLKKLIFGPETTYRLKQPYGVAADGRGRIYVADNGLGVVVVFDEAKRKVSFIGDSGTGKLWVPIDVKLAADGRVFVSDAAQKRIFVYSPEGRLVAAYGKAGELENPAGIALDEERGRLYVVDTKKHQVLVYGLADGSVTSTLGRRGTGEGEFNFPTNAWVDGRGQLYIADTMNFRIQIFTPEGRFVRSIGRLGDGPGQFARLKGIAVDSEGHIYAADAAFNNFQIFDQEGQLLLWVGGPGAGPGEFRSPAGLFIDGQDRIYVADRLNGRIQAFQYLAAPGQAAGQK
ncbi:MAG: 6-bladed beta-propeller [Bacillota bacterium]|nr:6-bladed beta-propeller [Bacillota bacterium]